jgi:hypothetical protein
MNSKREFEKNHNHSGRFAVETSHNYEEMSPMIWRCVGLVRTDVSEESIASSYRLENLESCIS